MTDPTDTTPRNPRGNLEESSITTPREALDRIFTDPGGAADPREPDDVDADLAILAAALDRLEFYDATLHEPLGKLLERETAALAALDRAERLEAVRDAAAKVDAKTYSHIDDRDLFAEIHPRRWLDIVRRVDGRETRHEGDWLSDLYGAIKDLRAALKGEKG